MYPGSFCITAVFCILQSTIGKTTVQCQNLNRTILTDYARRLCPYSNICASKETSLPVNLESNAGCCIDCSCAVTCSLTNDCCFADLKQYDKEHGLIQECIVPSTNPLQSLQRLPFKMVVDMHQNERNDINGNGSKPCDQDFNMTTFWSLHPVYSPKSGQIYKNIQLAKCHGIDENDVVIWRTLVSCEHDPLLQFDISMAFQAFDGGVVDSHCSLHFLYPSSFEDVKSQICVQGQSQCLQDDVFLIPDHINMSHDDVRHACTSGLQSPFIAYDNIYENIFCMICNREFDRTEYTKTCNDSLLIDKQKITPSEFTALIDADFIKQKTAPKQHVAGEKEYRACRDDHGCKRTVCPTGQVTIGNRVCIYPAKKWNNNALEVYVKLTPRNVINASLLNSHNLSLSSSRDTKWYASPWADTWTMQAFAYTRSTDTKSYTGVVSWFLVRLVTVQQTKSVRSLINSIDRFLKQDWQLFLQGSTFLLSQSLSEFTRFHRIGHMTFIPDLKGFYDNSIYRVPDFALNVSLQHLLAITPSDLSPSGYITITKMFFCYQIRLDPTTYQLDKNTKLLYITSSNRILFQGEFSLTLNENGQYVPNLCEDDVEFYAVPLSAGAIVMKPANELIVQLLVMLLLHAAVMW